MSPSRPPLDSEEHAPDPAGADVAAAWPVRRSRAWSAAIVAALAMTVSYVDRQTLAALKVSVQADLHFDDRAYGYVLSAFSLSYLVAAPAAGVLIDRVGPRRGLAVAVGLWSLVAAAHMGVPGYPTLLVLRLLLGATEAPSFPGAASAIRRVLPPRDRPVAFGLLFTGSSIGSAISVPLAIALKIAFGWRAAFLGTALVAACWIPLWLLASGRGAKALLEPSPRGEATPRDAVYREASALPSAAREEEGFAGLVALLKEPPVQRALVLIVASAAAVNFVVNWLPSYLLTDVGVPPAKLGLYTAAPALMFDAGAVAFGRLVHPTRDRSKPLVLWAATFATSLAFLTFLGGGADAAIFASVCMFGGGALYSVLTSDMVSRIRPEMVARASGMAAAGQSLSYILVNPAIGAARQALHDYRLVTLGLGMLVLPGAVAWCLWPRIPPRRVD